MTYGPPRRIFFRGSASSGIELRVTPEITTVGNSLRVDIIDIAGNRTSYIGTLRFDNIGRLISSSDPYLSSPGFVKDIRKELKRYGWLSS